jgi:hypothetical protein
MESGPADRHKRDDPLNLGQDSEGSAAAVSRKRTGFEATSSETIERMHCDI